MQCEVSEAELNRMTLQVGLLGSDGIVLASDTRVIRYTGTEPAYRRETKIVSSNQVISCWAGDDVSLYAAKMVAGFDWGKIPADASSINTNLCKIARKAWSAYKKSHNRNPPAQNRTVISALVSGTLWELDLSHFPTAHCTDRIVSGDVENSARFLINKYGRDCTKRPIADLVTLAAYTIIAAGEENPRGVDGLEVAVIPQGGAPFILTPEQEQDLYDRASAISQTLRDGLFQSFPLPNRE